MQEIIPFILGLVLGTLAGIVRPRMSPWIGIACSIVLGGLATVITGEFRSTWGYVFIDIPLVAAAAFAGLAMAQRSMRTRV